MNEQCFAAKNREGSNRGPSLNTLLDEQSQSDLSRQADEQDDNTFARKTSVQIFTRGG